jgi:hypothetical protein
MLDNPIDTGKSPVACLEIHLSPPAQGIPWRLQNPSTRNPEHSRTLPPTNAAAEELRLEAEACLSHPVADFLIHALDGLVLILGVHRQVLATDDRVLEVVDPEDGSPLGRCPGELFGCVHVPEGPGGCGTSHACARCGAVLTVNAVEASFMGETITLPARQEGPSLSGKPVPSPGRPEREAQPGSGNPWPAPGL